MTYKLAFHRLALREWYKLDHTIRQQFKTQPERRLIAPHVPSARLHGSDARHLYKIKLRALGYRLVYDVKDDIVTVLVLSVGKRDDATPYTLAIARRQERP